MEMDVNRKTTEQKFSSVEFQIFPTDYHTWGFPVFVLEAQLQIGPEEIPKWEPRARSLVYIGHSPFHKGSVALVLNTRTGHVSPKYHVVFDDTFSTVENTRKVTVPDLTTGSDSQVTPSSITEDPVSEQGIEASSDTLIHSTGEGSHHIGRSHQIIYSNSVQNPTDVNLDAKTMASPSGEEHDLPSPSSRLIPAYANFCTSGLSRSKIIQDKYKR